RAVVLPAHLAPEGGADGLGAIQARGARRLERRLRAGGARPRNPGRGPAARHEAGGAGGPALHAPAPRPQVAGTRAPSRRRSRRLRRPAERRGRAGLRRTGGASLMTQRQWVTAVLLGIVVTALFWIDPLFIPLALLGPLVVGATAGGPGGAGLWGAVGSVIAGRVG